MVDLAPSLRDAREDDARQLWIWRNDPSVRAVSLSTEEIPIAQHTAWFTRALTNPDREILIVELEAKPVGMVRFDRDDNFTSVHILLDPIVRGKKLALPALNAAISASQIKSSTLRATVRAGNVPSLKIFRGSGFKTVADGDPLVLERKLD